MARRPRSPYNRDDFADAESYARTMAEHGTPSLDDIAAFEGLAGDAGRLLDAIWGTEETRRAEVEEGMRLECQARWHTFFEKYWRRPRSSSPAITSPPSTLLGEADVASALSAAQFAWEKGLLLDTSVTLSFSLMGLTEGAAVKAAWIRFRKRLAQSCRDNGLPRAWIGVVENAPKIGLHAYLALHMPVARRDWLRESIERWARDECEATGCAFDPKAVAVSRHRKVNPLLHNRFVHYALKGFDPNVVVQEANDAPDGCAVLLGDLLAYRFECPGRVPFRRLVVGCDIDAARRGAWRSAYERGARDVNVLYDKAFVNDVRRQFKPVLPPSAADAFALVARANAVARAADDLDAAGPALTGRDDQFAARVIVLRVDAARQAVDVLVHLVHGFTQASDPGARRLSLASAAVAVRAALREFAEGGDEVLPLAAPGSPLTPFAVRALAALYEAEAPLREFAPRLQVVAAPPRWVGVWSLRALGI